MSVKTIFIKSGEWAVAESGVLIRTDLGSCVALCLWDPENRVGGMNHYVLPDTHGNREGDGRDGRFANEALLREILGAGAALSSLRAAVIGGGTLRPEGDVFNIGENNAAMAESLLREYGIPVVHRRVGGAVSRSVALDTAGGWLEVKEIKMGSGQADRYCLPFAGGSQEG